MTLDTIKIRPASERGLNLWRAWYNDTELHNMTKIECYYGVNGFPEVTITLLAAWDADVALTSPFRLNVDYGPEAAQDHAASAAEET